MARGILVTYAGYPYTLSSLFPDNGLASLAAVLRAEGHEVRIFDYNTADLIGRLVDPASSQRLKVLYQKLKAGPDPETMGKLLSISRSLEPAAAQVARDIAAELIRHCRDHRIDFVGFKLWSGDGFEASVQIAERIRAELPRIKLFAGGPAVHYSGQVAAAEAPVFDAVIDGDGEDAILELALFAEGKRALDGVPNRLLPGRQRSAQIHETDLASLPIPDYSPEVYPSLQEGGKIKLFSIDESRGCPMQCAFCVNWCIEGSRWRTRSPQQVVAEIQSLLTRQHTRCFRLAGTYSPPALVEKICQGILEQGLQVEFGLYLHGKGVTQPLLDLMKRAGCYGVFLGVESGSDRILRDAMNKHIDTATLRRVLKACLDTGFFTAGSFIFPAPFETEESERETKALIEEVFVGREKGIVNLNFPGLLPDTPWWNRRDHYGFSLTVDESAYRTSLLRMKIKHLVPPTLWDALPYNLHGVGQIDLARQNSEMQAWALRLGLTVNLADYDAHIGDRLGHGIFEYKRVLSRVFFSGDLAEVFDTVDRFNRLVAV
ncbi:MAG: cobalamin-dependent protein [Bradymonadales bacterium]|nr:cobalamin-dependent protein [Bradymonadales bacterium]